jgi:hypothetical protein
VRALEVDDAQRVGPFTVLARLGSGAMGTVYLGRSAGGRRVAVKVVHPRLAADADFRERFRREVDAARRVGGFWTAAVVDADVDAPQPWLASEFVAGPTLHEAVGAAGPLPEHAVRGLAGGLAEALTAIHATGLVHRDVKPSNVLLADDGPRLIDFGIARALDHSSLTAAGLVFGTPGYAAPEQVAGHGVGPASDVFSLGAVLVHASTGRSPFGRGTGTELLRRTVTGPPDLRGVPAGLLPLVTACLARDPHDRPHPPAIVQAVAAGGPSGTGVRPPPVPTLVATRAGPPAPPRPPARADTGDDVRPAPPAVVPAPPVAVFQAHRGWAALRAGLLVLGLLVAGGLGDGDAGVRALGGLLFLACAVGLVALAVPVVRSPLRIEVGRDGIAVVRRRGATRLEWTDVGRVGVAQAGRHPWLVVWPSTTTGAQALHGLPRHHGGHRVHRVGAWRSRQVRAVESRELRAALTWFAGARVDQRL